jgi:cytochrome b
MIPNKDMSEQSKSSSSTNQTLVWDLPIRIFHWLLVMLILSQWLTAEILEDAINWHVIGGYILLGLVFFRLLWGFIGTHYALFKNFLYPPKTIINYAASLPNRKSTAYAGHNPIGGLVVLLLLVLLLLMVISGLFMDDEIFTSGPYFGMASEYWQKMMSKIHHTAFDILSIVIALHIVAIIFYRLYKGQKLVSAMWHGYKNIEETGIKSQRIVIAIITAIIVGLAVYILVYVLPPQDLEIYY